MAGLHIVKKPMSGFDRYYVYAWRGGGPCIHIQDGSYPTITPEILQEQQKAKAKRYDKTKDGFEMIIQGYSSSPEFNKLGERTKKEYRRWLNRASERFGNLPLHLFESRKMRGEIIEWKNLWESQPRSADSAALIMSMLLGWAVENGYLQVNVAAKIKNIHNVRRADKIWEDKHWEQIAAAKLPKHLMDCLFVAKWTGLRLGDLVSVGWEHIGPKAIVLTTHKRKGRAVIPILPELRAWLDQMPEEEQKGTLLKNSRGYSWTESGLDSSFRKKRPKGFNRKIHDLRGTFCTMLIVKGLTDEQVGMIMGWTAKRIAEIRARYVDEERVITSLLDKLAG